MGVPVRYLGIVAVPWGLGAFLASMTLTRYPLVERKGLVVSLAVLGFGLFFVIFAIRPTVAFAMLGQFGIGASMTTAQVSGTALIQLLVPNEVRGRVMGVLHVNTGLAQLMTPPHSGTGSADVAPGSVSHPRVLVARGRIGHSARPSRHLARARAASGAGRAGRVRVALGEDNGFPSRHPAG